MPASSVIGLMMIGFSVSLLLLIPLAPTPPGDPARWRVLLLVATWFVIVLAGALAGVSRRAARWLTVGVGAAWYATLGVLQDDGDGLWVAGLLSFGLPTLVVISVAATALAERVRASARC